MKKYLLLVLLTIMVSCSIITENPPPPEEPCEMVHLGGFKINTYGFNDDKYDNVIIKAFENQSGIKTMINIDTLDLGFKDYDRFQRDIILPEWANTSLEYELIFSDSTIYNLNNFKTEYIARYCHEFCGYECSMFSYDLNGNTDTSDVRIIIKHVDY